MDAQSSKVRLGPRLLVATVASAVACVVALVIGPSAVKQCADQALLKAVESGNVQEARRALECGADPNFSWYGSVLVGAVTSNDVAMTKLLLDRGAKPSFSAYMAVLYERGGRRAASEQDRVHITDMLLSSLPHGPSDVKNTWLNYASGSGDPNIVQECVNYGADVNAADTDLEGTPIMSAVQQRDPGSVALLIRDGARVNPASLSDPSPLVEAVRDGDLDCVKLLVAAGADVNTQGEAPLRTAADGSNPDIAQYLIEHGANVSAVRIDDSSEEVTISGNGHIVRAEMMLTHDDEMTLRRHEQVIETIEAAKAKAGR